MKVKTSELKGVALDWAVAYCMYGKNHDFNICVYVTSSCGVKYVAYRHEFGMPESRRLNYSTDWTQGGPIIEREKISIIANYKQQWTATKHLVGNSYYLEGPTPLIAAMRCYVASKLGDDIEIPDNTI